VFFQSPEVAGYFAEGTVVHRMGNADRAMAPHGVYPCLPGDAGARFVAIACRDDADWQLLAAEIGRPDLAGDRALGTAAGRCGRAGELDAAVAAWTVTQPAERVERRLQDAGVPAHVSSSSRDFCTDPQLGFVIAKENVGFDPMVHTHSGPWKNWNLYDCRTVRLQAPVA